jgi:ribose 5-phosphate isomerase B
VRVAIGSDHAGFELKQILIEELKALGDAVTDYGTDSLESCDYPDIAEPLARAVSAEEHDFGVLICSNGVGPSIVANKIHGVRCGLCHDTFSARRAREHTNCNILAMGAWAIGRGAAVDVLMAFRNAEFEGGRHELRIGKLNAIDDAMRLDAPATGSTD